MTVISVTRTQNVNVAVIEGLGPSITANGRKTNPCETIIIKQTKTDIDTRGGMIHVFVTNRHGKGISVHKSKYSIIFPYLQCNVSEC